MEFPAGRTDEEPIATDSGAGFEVSAEAGQLKAMDESTEVRRRAAGNERFMGWGGMEITLGTGICHSKYLEYITTN